MQLAFILGRLLSLPMRFTMYVASFPGHAAMHRELTVPQLSDIVGFMVALAAAVVSIQQLEDNEYFWTDIQ